MPGALPSPRLANCLVALHQALNLKALEFLSVKWEGVGPALLPLGLRRFQKRQLRVRVGNQVAGAHLLRFAAWPRASGCAVESRGVLWFPGLGVAGPCELSRGVLGFQLMMLNGRGTPAALWGPGMGREEGTRRSPRVTLDTYSTSC